MNLKNAELVYRLGELLLVEFRYDITNEAKNVYPLSEEKAKIMTKQLIDYLVEQGQSEFKTNDGKVYKFSRELKEL